MVALKYALDTAPENVVEPGELAREETDKVHEFVTCDLYDAWRNLAMEQREVADWLRLGMLPVEKTLLSRFTSLAQRAKLELRHREKARRRLDEWHTGEVTTIGTLCCCNCSELIHFERTGRNRPARSAMLMFMSVPKRKAYTSTAVVPGRFSSP